jgi:NADH dehydrogenase/NADH:ubiquinone oxidoreductase subunit G
MVRTVVLNIDNKKVRAKEGTSILDAAKKSSVDIPTLCHENGLDPYGACRICSVEIEKKGRAKIVAACCYPVEEGLKVRTKSPKINRIRKTIIELAAMTAGEGLSGKMGHLASKYNADLLRFRSRVPIESTNCILCGLCINRCVEANWDSVIGFVGRGVNKRVVLFPDRAGICSICNYCYDVCPTGRISSIGPSPQFPHIDNVIAGRE